MEESYAKSRLRQAQEEAEEAEQAALEARLAKPPITHRFGVPVGQKPPNSGRKKGTPKTGGRVKGSKNKYTLSAKQRLDTAFEESGGVRAFTEWAKENRTEFYKIYSRTIPQEKQISGPKGDPIQVDVGIEFVKP